MTAKLPWSSDPGTTFESEVFLENVELLNNQDVIKLVKEINIYKSSGLPNINSRLLKDGFMALIDQFTFVLNLSLKTNPGQLDTGQLGTGHLDTGQLGTGQLGTHESGKVGQLDTSI